MTSERSRNVLSYGGGLNSFALLLLLLEKGRRLDEVVFADTGAELPETYAHINFVRSFLRSKGIAFTVVKSRNGSLYDTCKRRRVIPSMIWRWSTRDYKITPIYAHYRSMGCHVNQYLAIAWDEIERMKDSKADYVTNLYPLIDEKMTRGDCIEIIRAQRHRVPVKSGCFFCPFNTEGRWRFIYGKHRNLFKKALSLEEQSKHFPKQKLQALTLRGMKSNFEHGTSGAHELRIATPCGAECMT